MPYRALTHGRIAAPINFKGNGTGKNMGTGLAASLVDRTDSQKKAYNSEAGVSNSGSTVSQRNMLNMQSGRVGGSRPCYARLLSRDLLMSENALDLPKSNNTFSPNQGKGFPAANPTTSVGSTNKFARRAIKRRAVTSTFVNRPATENCKCD